MISQDLSWTNHIDNTVKKANRSLGFLRRNLRINDEAVKGTAYKTIVRPIMEYCSSVWSPHLKKTKHHLEMVQRRAARYVTGRYRNTSSVEDMLNHLKWETLEDRRTKARATMIYKIVRNLVSIDKDTYLIPSTSVTRKKHQQTFRQPHSSKDCHKYSFFPAGIRIWNDLTPELVESQDVDTFKTGLASQHS